jgi:DNA repair protein RadC
MAAGIIVVHNHPSGDPAPSQEDEAVTKRLIEAGKLLDIPLLDHMIMAKQGCYSFREQHGNFWIN